MSTDPVRQEAADCQNPKGVWLGLLLLSALIIAFMLPALVPGNCLMTFDTGRWSPWSEADGEDLSQPSFNADNARFVLPRAHLIRQAVAGGELPLWDPTSFLGGPFLALWQTEVIYPPNLLLLAVPARESLAWMVLLHLLIAGAGFLLFCRSTGLSIGASWLGGLLFSLGGHMVLRMGHPSFVLTICWLPWVLLAAERYVSKRRSRWILLLTVSFTLLLLAGQATLAALSGYLAGAYVLQLAWGCKGERWKVSAALLGALLCATLLAGPQVLPSLELANRSGRAERALERLQGRALHPLQALQWIEPEVFGTVRERSYTPPQQTLGSRSGGTSYAASVAGYVGAWMPVLAVLGLFSVGGWGRRRGFWIAVAAVSLGLAFATPLFTASYTLLPGFRFSTISRAAVFFAVAVAILAARGADRLQRGELGARTLWLVGAGPPLLAAAVWIMAERFVPAGEPMPLLAVCRLVLGAAAGAALIWASRWLCRRRLFWPLLLAAVAVELICFAVPYRVVRPAERVLHETPSLQWVRARGEGQRVARFDGTPRAPWESGLCRASALSVFDLREPGGFAPMHADSLNLFLERIGWQGSNPWGVPAISDLAVVENKLFPLLAVKFLVAGRDADLEPLNLVHRGDLSIWELEHSLPPGFLVREVVAAENLDQALEVMDRTGFDPSRTAVVTGLHDPPVLGPPSSTDAVSVLDRTFNTFTIQTRTESKAWLVLSEAWAPGWRVFEDGKEVARTLPVNGIFQGFFVPEGSHVWTMRYAPSSYRWGWWLFGAGLILLAGVVWANRYFRFHGETR